MNNFEKIAVGPTMEDGVHKLEFDLNYLKHFKEMRDIRIMLQTFRILSFAQGGR